MGLSLCATIHDIAFPVATALWFAAFSGVEKCVGKYPIKTSTLINLLLISHILSLAQLFEIVFWLSFILQLRISSAGYTFCIMISSTWHLPCFRRIQALA
jgi:hypothetical protein